MNQGTGEKSKTNEGHLPSEDATKKLCACGAQMEPKNFPVGWGHKPIEVCSNPDCPEKKKKTKTRAGWC